MTTFNHSLSKDVHRIVRWRFANAATRAAKVNFKSTDVDKVARDLDTDTFHVVLSVSSGVATWKALDNLAGVGHSGYSATLNKLVDTASLQESVDELMAITYTAPTITIASVPTSTLREKGTAITSITLNATTVKKSSPITAVTFYRDGSLIHTVASPAASGGLESYVDATGFADTTTYSAKVSDGTSLITATVTHTFVYPYYYGVDAPGLIAAEVAGLTKAVISSTASKAVTSSPSNQVFYFAYPASYGSLTSILDTNGFETISDYTKRTEDITGLDGLAVSYFIYEFNNLTTQTNFTNTYKR